MTGRKEDSRNETQIEMQNKINLLREQMKEDRRFTDRTKANSKSELEIVRYNIENLKKFGIDVVLKHGNDPQGLYTSNYEVFLILNEKEVNHNGYENKGEIVEPYLAFMSAGNSLDQVGHILYSIWVYHQTKYIKEFSTEQIHYNQENKTEPSLSTWD